MTYDAIQNSVEQADPIYLFTVTIATTVLRYTSASHDIEVAGETWIAAPIIASDIELGDKMEKEEFTLTVPVNFELVQKLRGFIYSRTSLVVSSFYDSDPDHEIVTEFVGADATVVQASSTEAGVVFSSVYRLYQREGLGPRFSKNCRYAIFMPGCNLSKAPHSQTVELDSVDGKYITIAETPAPGMKFAGGVMETSAGVGFYIYGHDGQYIELFEPVPLFRPGDIVTIYEGCDQSLTRCRELGNANNFGGDFWLKENPFDGRYLR